MKTQFNWKNPWLFPAILIFIYAVIYLPNLTRLGFHWDDWQIVFLNLMNSPVEYWNYFLVDRPFSIWTYLLSVPLLGMSPLPWQIFTLVIRIAAAWFFSAALSIVFPKRIWEARWAAVLLLVFPGFTQTTISVAFSQHFISQTLFFASLWLMLKAVNGERPSIWMISLACLFSLVQLLTMEYFAALELIRPFLLFLFFRNNQSNSEKTSFKRTIRAWPPYLLPLVLFAVWRFGYYPRLSTENSPTLLVAILTDPFNTIKQFIQFALQDTFSTSFSVWMDALKPATLDYRTIVSLFTALIGAGLTGAWFWRTSSADGPSSSVNDRFAEQAAVIGLLLLFLGGLPVWSTNRQVLVGLWSDRFTLAPMTGSVILLIAITTWLTQNRPRQVVLLVVMTAMAIYSQILTVEKYADNWEIQRNYYWQLKWRVPDLLPNTAIVAPKLPTSYISDYAVGFALNAMYAKQPVTKHAQYWFFIGPRAEGDYFKSYLPGLPVKYTLRDVIYEGTTDQTLGVSFAAGRDCLRVLDPFYTPAPPMLSENLGGIEKDIQPISNINRILPESSSITLRSDVFGLEPARTWCYYYQKADLARQFAKWDEIPKLADEAEKLSYRSKNGMEFLPFIEGYAQTGKWDRALETTLVSNSLTFGMSPALCSMWQRYEKMGTSADLQKQSAEFHNRVNCPLNR
ncbi:MAG: hypothetical protein WCG34_07455 [Leptolinea sp.]